MDSKTATLIVRVRNQRNLRVALDCLRDVNPLGFGDSATLISAIERLEDLVRENDAELVKLDG